MRDDYDFANMTAEANPYIASLTQHVAVPFDRAEAHKLVDQLPDDATWDDLIHAIHVREVIEKGLGDSKAGRTTDVRDVRAKYGHDDTEG